MLISMPKKNGIAYTIIEDSETVIPGDINGDNVFTSIDALCLLKNIDSAPINIADVNDVQMVDIKDVLLILDFESRRKVAVK